MTSVVQTDFVSGYRYWLHDIAVSLEDLDHDKPLDKNELRLFLLNEYGIDRNTCETVFRALTAEGFLSPRYGAYKIVGESSKLLGR